LADAANGDGLDLASAGSACVTGLAANAGTGFGFPGAGLPSVRTAGRTFVAIAGGLAGPTFTAGAGTAAFEAFGPPVSFGDTMGCA